MRSDRIEPPYFAIAETIQHSMYLNDLHYEVSELVYKLRHAAYVRGYELGKHEYMMTEDMPTAGGGPLSFQRWIAVKALGYRVEPTPGYDADGRECWEYPT